jgi:hypothetical protein
MTQGSAVENDRELLKDAAKAAGYWAAEFNCPANLPRPDWNPLTNDGDALRLAVKLGIMGRQSYNGQDYEAANKDPYAATRRAIVKTAAEIAKGLKHA